MYRTSKKYSKSYTKIPQKNRTCTSCNVAFTYSLEEIEGRRLCTKCIAKFLSIDPADIKSIKIMVSYIKTLQARDLWEDYRSEVVKAVRDRKMRTLYKMVGIRE